MSNKNEDKIEFSNLLKDSNNLNEYHTKFAWHVAWHNKLMIWCKMLNNVYLTVKLYTILGFSSYYFYAKVIKDDTLSMIMQFAFNSQNSYVNLLIICVTAICFYFIKSRYK